MDCPASTQFDAGTIQSVIDKLRDLSATKFADKMGGTQTLTVAVTSGENHRVEKVTINKNGDALRRTARRRADGLRDRREEHRRPAEGDQRASSRTQRRSRRRSN